MVVLEEVEEAMKVSIILTYLDKPHPRCVESIKNQTYKNIEIVMGTEKDFGVDKKMGLGWIRNRLAERATGDILLFTDSDATMHPDFVKNIIKIFEEQNPDVISGIPMAPEREDTDFLSYILGVEYEARIRAIGEGFVSICSGTCFAVKREVFEDVGGLIETQTFGEDWYFSKKIEEKGYKIWHTNTARITVYKWESFWKYLKKQYVYAKYRVYHAKKFKHTTDEYPLMKTDYLRYNAIEKIVFPIFYGIRASVWILGAVSGVWDYIILRKEI